MRIFGCVQRDKTEVEVLHRVLKKLSSILAADTLDTTTLACRYMESHVEPPLTSVTYTVVDWSVDTLESVLGESPAHDEDWLEGHLRLPPASALDG